MRWQEKAVEAVALAEHGEYWRLLTEDCRKFYLKRAERQLRAALPLIEVTPGMSEAAWVADDASASGDAIHAALTRCAEEGRS